MSASNLTPSTVVETIIYPESDGEPMADNSKQFRYITTIEGNLEILFEAEARLQVEAQAWAEAEARLREMEAKLKQAGLL